MICRSKVIWGLVVICSTLMLVAALNPLTSNAATTEKKAKVAKVDPIDSWASKPNAAFDAKKMGNVSDFDPATWVSPTGDTIKIGYVNTFSGPGALNGHLHLVPIMFAVHDINKRGGIWVDGKKKLVELIKADTMNKPDQTKKVCERLVLQEKVQFLMGTSSSALMKIINDTANKYKIISVDEGALSDDLMDSTHFGRYTFMATASTEQLGRGLAYYYGQIRKKEKTFYILCQDYSFRSRLGGRI